MKAVVDASAVLAALNRERGWQRATQFMPDGALLSICLGEVVTKLARYIDDRAMIADMIEEAAMDVVVLDAGLAFNAGLINPHLVRGGLSLADRCCLVYAKANGLPAVTADRAWSQLAEPLGIEIIQIRD